MHIDIQTELVRQRQQELLHEARLQQAIRAAQATEDRPRSRRARLARLAIALAGLAAITSPLTGAAELAWLALSGLMRL